MLQNKKGENQENDFAFLTGNLNEEGQKERIEEN